MDSVPRLSGTGEYLVLTPKQAAAIFRLHVQRALGGCQYEQGHMRWWLAQGLVLTLEDGQWRLSVVPDRRGCCEEETA